MSPNEAKGLQFGEKLHLHILRGNARGTERWRVNGQVRTWKRTPERFLVPLKHGLYDYFYMSENNCIEFHKEKECRVR